MWDESQFSNFFLFLLLLLLPHFPLLSGLQALPPLSFFSFSSPFFFYLIPYLIQEKQHEILWLQIRKFLWVGEISEVLPPSVTGGVITPPWRGTGRPGMLQSMGVTKS